MQAEAHMRGSDQTVRKGGRRATGLPAVPFRRMRQHRQHRPVQHMKAGRWSWQSRVPDVKQREQPSAAFGIGRFSKGKFRRYGQQGDLLGADLRQRAALHRNLRVLQQTKQQQRRNPQIETAQNASQDAPSLCHGTQLLSFAPGFPVSITLKGRRWWNSPRPTTAHTAPPQT